MKQSAERPVVLSVDDAPLSPAAREQAARLLAEGEIVAVPTETVYGLAVRADDPAAVGRLRELKGSGKGRGFTWHAATPEAVEAFPFARPLARRLARRYWPGPLTLVLDGVPERLRHVAAGGAVGVRVPAHRATLDLLAAVDFPVVATSANPDGRPPLLRGDHVPAAFGAAVALVLDGGPSRLAEASGVLRIAPGRFELLREGLLPIDALRRTAGLRLGFACTGNTCRSPMAAALARERLQRLLRIEGEAADVAVAVFGFAVESMGVSASFGSPAAQHAIEVMSEHRIDLSRHRSQPALPERVRSLDRVYCMTASHLEILRHSLPPGSDGNLELLDPTGQDVPDPIGGSRDDYRRCAEHMARAIEARSADWA